MGQVARGAARSRPRETAPRTRRRGDPMRNLLAFLGAAIVVFGGLGYYLDWYKIDRVMSLTGHQQISIDIDGKKIAGDVHRGAERGAEKIQDLLEKHRQAEAESHSKSTVKDSERPHEYE